tara:strand:- start:27 stop:137 length:111 start_codon:yes stop_codon:yes gene_type:complete
MHLDGAAVMAAKELAAAIDEAEDFLEQFPRNGNFGQ